MIVPRLVRTLSGEEPPLGDVWGDTSVTVEGDSAPFHDILTGRAISATMRHGRPTVALAEALTTLPVAVLTGQLTVP